MLDFHHLSKKISKSKEFFADIKTGKIKKGLGLPQALS
jgi:hypothetical protein